MSESLRINIKINNIGSYNIHIYFFFKVVKRNIKLYIQHFHLHLQHLHLYL